MAKKVTAAASVATETRTAKKEPLSDLQRSVFTVDEFAARHAEFGTTADMVKTALLIAGVRHSCTYDHAMKVVKSFLKK